PRLLPASPRRQGPRLLGRRDPHQGPRVDRPPLRGVLGVPASLRLARHRGVPRTRLCQRGGPGSRPRRARLLDGPGRERTQPRRTDALLLRFLGVPAHHRELPVTLAAVDPAPTGARRVKALVRRVLRPVVVRIRWVAARLDLGGAAQAETASRGVASLRAAIATLEVTVAEQAESIDE